MHGKHIKTKLAYSPFVDFDFLIHGFFFPANSRRTGLEENMKAHDEILQLLESVRLNSVIVAGLPVVPKIVMEKARS